MKRKPKYTVNKLHRKFDVTKDVRANSVVVGVSAKVIKQG